MAIGHIGCRPSLDDTMLVGRQAEVGSTGQSARQAQAQLVREKHTSSGARCGGAACAHLVGEEEEEEEEEKRRRRRRMSSSSSSSNSSSTPPSAQAQRLCPSQPIPQRGPCVPEPPGRVELQGCGYRRAGHAHAYKCRRPRIEVQAFSRVHPAAFRAPDLMDSAI